MSDTNEKYHKLAAAIYLITSFFADQEPLKWKLRGLSADLVSEGGKDKNACIRDILALFGIAKAANLVSGANYDILVDQFSKLEEEAGKPVALLFASQAEKSLPAPETSTPEPKPEPRRELLKDIIRETTVKTTEERPQLLREFGAVSVKKNSRQSIIIALLKRKKEIMIKDVSPLISGCSEKTIQRELSEMVAAGILKRIGEKRWTRYSLA